MLEELLSYGVVYALIGGFAGLSAGVLGIGGGMVVVPGLAYVFAHRSGIPSDLVMHMAAGSSLAVMMVTAQSAVRAHFKMGKVLLPVFKHMWPGIVLGCISGSVAARFIPTHWLAVIFGVFLILIALNMLFNFHLPKSRGFPRDWVNFLINGLIGFKSGLLGIGGGALIIPYLSYCGIDMRKIAPISSLCTLTVSVFGTLAFILLGLNRPDLPVGASGYVYWPAVIWVAIPSYFLAPIGARLTYKLPVKQLRTGFVIFLMITALDMLFS